MTITASQVKEIRQEFARLKPAAVTLDGNRTMTVKRAIFTLAPTLERMKKRGFDTQEIVEKLHEKGIEVKPQTLTKYLTESRWQKEARKSKRQAASSWPNLPGGICVPSACGSAQAPHGVKGYAAAGHRNVAVPLPVHATPPQVRIAI